MIAILCPGQGSQTPGMLTPWLDLPGTADLLGRLSAAAEVDLIALGTTADADTIRDTAVAQPLIVAASLVSLAALTNRTGAAPSWAGVTAGHSVGEYAAAAVAGVLTDAQALELVGIRGRAMAAAAAQTPTGMSAVIGGDPAEVLARLAELELVPANVNGGGQVVAAGALLALERLRSSPPAKARVIPLAVAGAFHTDYMASAVEAVSSAAAGLAPADPTITLLTNADGTTVASGSAAVDGMVRQIARPVRWDACQATLADLGVTGIIELCPAGVLTGLARRSLRGVDLLAVKSPDDLDGAAQFIADHRTATEES